jgi:hypothetical protein
MKNKLLLFLTICLVAPAMAQQDSSMKFDLGISKGQNLYLWPILRIRKAPGYKNTEVFFSAFQNKHDHKGFHKHSHLFPLYYYDSNLRRNDLKLGTLFYPSLFHYHHKFADSIRSYKIVELAPGISLAEVTKSTDGLFVKNNAFLFLWYKKDLRTQKAYSVLFPVFWHFENGPKRFNSVFPVYWSYKKNQISNQVFFPIVWKFKNEKRTSLKVAPIFSYGKNPSKGRTYFALTPLFWHFNYGNEYKQVLFPIYWKHKSEKLKNTTIFPIYWSRVNAKSNNKVVFPLIWSFKNDTRKWLTVLPIFSYGKSFKEEKSHLVITPLFWHTYNYGNYRTFLFPVYWKFKNELVNNTTIFPIYWSRENNEFTKKVLFPIIWSYRDDNYRSFTFFPLYSYGISEAGPKNHLVITPLYWRVNDKNSEKRVLFPVYFHYKFEEDRIKVKHGDTSFYKYLDETTVLFPIYYLQKIQNSRDTIFNQTVFPVYWKRQRNHYDNTTIFPFYWSKKNQFEQTQYFLPFVINYKSKSYKSFTLLPLFSRGYSPNGLKSHLFIFPLFYQLKDTNQFVQGVFPFYKYSKIRDLDYSGNMRLTESSRMFFLYTATKTIINEDTSITKSIFPIYWKTKNSFNDNVTVFPLYYKWNNSERQLTVVFPVYFIKYNPNTHSKTVGITPLFWHTKKENKVRYTFFPLYWYKYSESKIINSKKTNHTLFPIWFSRTSVVSDTVSKKTQLLFPFYMKNYSNSIYGYNSLTIMPFYSKGASVNGSRSHFAVTPFFWKYTSTYVKRTIVFPLYWYKIRNYKDSNPTISHSVFPLFYCSRKLDKKRFILFPLVWYKKTVNKRNLVLFPIYYDFKSYDSRKVFLLPVFLYTKYRQFDSSVFIHYSFPLIWYSKKQSKTGELLNSNLSVFPIYRQVVNETYQSTALFPLAYIYRDKVNQNFIKIITPFVWDIQKDETRFKMVFPFYMSYEAEEYLSPFVKAITPFYWKWGDDYYNTTLLFPLASKTEFENGNLNYNFLWFVYRQQKTNTRTSTQLFWPLTNFTRDTNYFKAHIAPVFWYKKHLNSEGKIDKSHLVIFPVFWHKMNNSVERTALLPLFYISKNKLNSNRFSMITPLYWNVKNTSYRSKILFPLYMNYEKDSAVELGITKLKAITPLYWKWNDGYSSKSMLFPLYFKSKTIFNEMNSSVLGFVYRHQKTDTRNSVQLLWPLINFTKDTNLRYAHVVPFVWYKKSTQQDYFSIQPFYYQGRYNQNYTKQILWQLVHTRTTPEKKTIGIFFHALHIEKYKNGDHAFRFIYLLIADINKNGVREKSFFPFYYMSKDTLGNKNMNAVLAFYGRSAKRIKETNYFYKEEKVFWIVRFRSNYKYLKSKGIVKNRKELR